MNVNELSSEQKIIVAARFLYRFGEQLISDQDYDKLVVTVTSKYPNWEYLKRNYDEDDVPVQILRELKFTDEEIKSYIQAAEVNTSERVDRFEAMLAESSNKGIHSTQDFYEAYEWFKQWIGKVVTLTPKVDGSNCKALFATRKDSDVPDADGNYNLLYSYAKTRGDDGHSFIVTDGIQKIVPNVIKSPQKYVIVRGDALTHKSVVGQLVATNGKPMVTSRGAGLAMLRRTDIDAMWYDRLYLMVFRVEGFKSLVEGLDFAKSQGFRTVPYYKIVVRDQSYDDFVDDISARLKTIKADFDAKGIDTDGVVAQIDDASLFASKATTHLYDGGNIALKMQEWGSDRLTGKVVDIKIQQSSFEFSCKAEIEPVTTNNGRSISTVNLFNPGIMFERGIDKGSTIEFVYKNATTVDLV